jgi:hypothetical protein
MAAVLAFHPSSMYATLQTLRKPCDRFDCRYEKGLCLPTVPLRLVKSYETGRLPDNAEAGSQTPMPAVKRQTLARHGDPPLLAALWTRTA